MALEIRLHGKVVFRSSFPVCRADPSTVTLQGEASKVLHFTFKPHRAIVWGGYREGDDTTLAHQTIAGDIWLAGREPDVLLLGVAFTSLNKVYMNTVHVCHPAQRDRTLITSGLFVTTYPAGQAERKQVKKQ